MATATPEAPRAIPDITMRPSGKVTTIPAGNGGALQAALDAREPGERIQCDPTQPMVGNFEDRARTLTAYAILTSTRDDVPLRMISPNRSPVLSAGGPVGGLYLKNIDASVDPAVTDIVWNLFLMGGGGPQSFDTCPRGYVFDRVNMAATDTQQLLRGLYLGARDMAYLNGTIVGMKAHGFDSQAICGGPAPGPYLIRDADLEGASENIMFGGTGVDGPDMVPQDITIERVTLRKRLSWQGQGWNIKNHLEFKSARRVKVRGLHCLNCWTDGQVGRSVVVTPRDVGTFPYIVTQDIDIEHVLIEDVNSAFVIMGFDDFHDNDPESTKTSRIRFRNWITRVNPGGMNFQVAAGSFDVELDRMTWVGSDLFANVIVGGSITRLKADRLLMAHGQHGWSGASGEGDRVAHLFPDAEWGQVMTVGPGASGRPGPPFLPGPLLAEQNTAAVFVDMANRDYHVRAGSVAERLGADPDAIAAALSGGSPNPMPPSAPASARVLSAHFQEN